MTRAGVALLVAVVFISVAAPWLAPNPPDRQFNTYFYAPPTSLHWSAGERFFQPFILFIYYGKLIDRTWIYLSKSKNCVYH